MRSAGCVTIEWGREVKDIVCSATNVGYVVTCLTCQIRGINKVYEGESGRSARIRADEHLAAIRRKQPSSALVQHILTDHAGEEEEPEFMFQVRQWFEDDLTCQSDEGVRIETSDEDSLMNTKQEWVPPALGRIRIS